MPSGPGRAPGRPQVGPGRGLGGAWAGPGLRLNPCSTGVSECAGKYTPSYIYSAIQIYTPFHPGEKPCENLGEQMGEQLGEKLGGQLGGKLSDFVPLRITKNQNNKIHTKST